MMLSKFMVMMNSMNSKKKKKKKKKKNASKNSEANDTEECKTDPSGNYGEDKSLERDGDTQEEAKTGRLSTAPQTKETATKGKKNTKAKAKSMATGNKVGNNTSDKSKGDTQNKKAVRNKSTKDLATSLEDFDNEEYSV